MLLKFVVTKTEQTSLFNMNGNIVIYFVKLYLPNEKDKFLDPWTYSRVHTC